MPIFGAVLLSLLLAGVLAGLAVRWYYVLPLRKQLHAIRQIRYGKEDRLPLPSAPHEVREINREFDLLYQAYRQLKDNSGTGQKQIEQAVVSRTRQFRRTIYRLEKQSQTDTLTGLANRACFDKQFFPFFTAAREQKSDLACLALDIDCFKQFNDRYGHGAGDQLLRFTGELIRSMIRETDLAARVGGDEFVVLLNGCSDQQAYEVAERIRSLFAHEAWQLEPPHAEKTSAHGQENRAETSPAGPGLSIGLATLNAHPRDARHLLQLADQSLYEAKRTGRNCAVMYRDAKNNLPGK